MVASPVVKTPNPTVEFDVEAVEADGVLRITDGRAASTTDATPNAQTAATATGMRTSRISALFR
jgi:hypothetical protein